MPLLSLDQVSLSFGQAPLLDRATLVIDTGERLALIGRNGTGKSSLLKVLAASQAHDDGVVWRQPGLKVATVEQEPEFEADMHAWDAVAQGIGDAAQALIAYHALTARLEHGESSDTLLTELETLSQQIEHAGGWSLGHRVDQALSDLGIASDARCGSMSGGQTKRLALARALAGDPDLLLLDEPTNHLDLGGIQWLEQRLKEFRGAVVVVTHDRRFLDQVATRILELDRGQLTSYPGSFATYLERKEYQLNAEALAQARADKLLAQEEVWIRQGVEARRTRSVGRVARLEHLRQQRAERRERQGQVKLALDRGEASGKLVVETEDASVTYTTDTGTKTVIRNLDLRIMRGDRIGIIGPNGAGKTSLLKLLLGEMPASGGTVRVGTKLQVAYFDQFREQLDPEATLADVISPGSDYVDIGGTRKHVVGYLGDFLFAPQRVRQPVKSLSGGERARLLLARLFARPANVLVLDEPTNDLDIETLELLEQLLDDYDGTVLLVSHDRAFLDAVVTQTLAWEGRGHWKEYVGGYEDWVRQSPLGAKGFDAAAVDPDAASAKPSAPAPAPAVPSAAPAPASAPGSNTAKPTAARKLSFKEQRELDALPGQIEALEAEQKTLTDTLTLGTIYKDSPQQAITMQQRLEAIDVELMTALERWELLESRR